MIPYKSLERNDQYDNDEEKENAVKLSHELHN